MKMYGAKQLADSFRGVRANTITIAEEIPEDQYGFRPVPGVKSVAEQLSHIAVATGWQIEVHTAEVGHIDFAMFGASLARGAAEEQALASKSAIVAALKERGDAVRVVSGRAGGSAARAEGYLPAAGAAVREDALRDAAFGEGARDAPSRAADGVRADARNRPASDPPAGRQCADRYGWGRGACS